MDGREANIEDRRRALLRILAALVAMAGLLLRPHPEVRAECEPRRTVSRHLRNAVFRLLRPAESAARRLVIALAAGLAVTPVFRLRKPKRPSRGRRQFMPKMPVPPGASEEPRYPKSLPLLDLARRKPGPRRARQTGSPYIGLGPRPPVRPLPGPGDRLDATRLKCRLDALGAALADLPSQALRFARWRARQAFLRARDKTCRAALRRPLRFGRPPGWLKRPEHEVHDVLDFCHQLALESLRRPDTS